MAILKNLWMMMWGVVALLIFWGAIILGVLIVFDILGRIIPVLFPNFWEGFLTMSWLDRK